MAHSATIFFFVLPFGFLYFSFFYLHLLVLFLVLVIVYSYSSWRKKKIRHLFLLISMYVTPERSIYAYSDFLPKQTVSLTSRKFLICDYRTTVFLDRKLCKKPDSVIQYDPLPS